MAYLASKLRSKKWIEADVEVAEFLRENSITERAMIYRLEFDKKVFKDEFEVREWLNGNYYSIDVITPTDSGFVAETLSTSQLDMGKVIDVEIRRGLRVFAADFMTSSSVYNFSDKDFSTDFKESNKETGLPKVIKVAKVLKGTHATFGEIDITKEHLLSFKDNFEKKVTGVDLAINEDHKKNEAFGWYKDLFLSEDGNELLATVKWNKKGTKSLNEGEYRYFSPEFSLNFTHPHTGVSHGPTLLGGALTNYPFLKMDAITDLNAKQEPQTKETKVSEKTIELSVHTEKVVELSTKNIELSNKLNLAETKVVELSSKVKELEDAQAKLIRESKHKKMFDDKLINAAQLIALNEGKSMLEVLELNSKMNMTASGGNAPADNGNGEVNLSEADKKMAKSLGVTEKAYAEANGLVTK